MSANVAVAVEVPDGGQPLLSIHYHKSRQADFLEENGRDGDVDDECLYEARLLLYRPTRAALEVGLEVVVRAVEQVRYLLQWVARLLDNDTQFAIYVLLFQLLVSQRCFELPAVVDPVEGLLRQETTACPRALASLLAVTLSSTPV